MSRSIARNDTLPLHSIDLDLFTACVTSKAMATTCVLVLVAHLTLLVIFCAICLDVGYQQLQVAVVF